MIDVALQKSFLERFTAIRTLDKKNLLPPRQALGSSFKDIGKGAFFEYQGRTYQVREINQYEETSEDFKKRLGYFIHELTCLCIETGETVNFEWEFDDELEISMTLEQLSFRDLKDDEGRNIDEDDLDQIAEDKDAVVAKNETFRYEDDWGSIFQRGKKEENVYMYEFENKAGTKFLSIEEWQSGGRGQYQIYTSVPVNPDSISILCKGEQPG